MTTTTTIRARDPRDLLALVPYQLGFVPEESAVLISIRRERSHVGLLARVDLPALADPEHGAQLARQLVGHLVDDGACRAVLVLWTADPVPPRAGGAQAETLDPPGCAARAARDHVALAAEHLLGAVDCWVVGPGGYREIDCVDPRCCPAQGRDIEDLQASAVSAEMVLRGHRPVASRAELGRCPEVTPEARRAARRAAVRSVRRRDAAADEASLRSWRRAGLRLWRELATSELAQDGRPRRGDAPLLGRMRAALDDVLVRDAVLVSLVPGCERVADALVAGEDCDELDAALRSIIDPVHGRAPQAVLVDPARRVLELVTAHCGAGTHPPSLTLLALVAWWSGDGARASVLVDRALDADPGHRLGVLVRDTLESGMPPGWVRVQRSRGAAAGGGDGPSERTGQEEGPTH